MKKEGLCVKVMKMLNLGICDYFSYPVQIKEQLREILSVIDPFYVRSVILRGSTAFGELGYRVGAAGIEIYGDYEFSVVPTAHADRKYRKRLNEHAAELRGRYSKTPFFSIDFYYGPVRDFRKGIVGLDVVSGSDVIVVFGEDVRHLIPRLTAETLNRHLHNEMLLWLLWRNILFCPVELLRGSPVPEMKNDCWKYILCKNCLYLAAWMLPHEGIFLPSYGQRNDFLDHNFRNLRAANFFDKRFVDLLHECYRGKTRLDFRDDGVSLYQDVMRYCISAKHYALDLHGLKADALFSGSRGVFFNDNNAMRSAYDIYLAMFSSRDRGLTDRIRWVLDTKSGMAVDFLYAINMSLHAYLGGRAGEASLFAEQARRLLEDLALSKRVRISGEPLPVGESLLQMRNSFAEFLSTYIPATKAYHDRILRFNAL